MTDRLLWTRRQRARDFALKLLGALGPTVLLALFVLLTGGRATAVAILVFGGLVVLAIVTGVRTVRGAVTGGFVIAAVLLLLQLAIAWLIDHPILE